MKGTLLGLVLFAGAALAVAPGGLSNQRGEAASQGKPALAHRQLAELGHKAEVFRRILFIELREALKPPAEIVASGGSSRCRRSPVRHVNATYLPGYGLSLVVGMRPARRPEVSSDQDPRDLLWQKVDIGTKANRSLWEVYIASRAPTCEACESQKSNYSVAVVADTVVRTLAAHGHRFDGLGAEDRVSVAIHLSDWSGDVMSHIAHSNQSSRGSGAAAVAAAPVIDVPVRRPPLIAVPDAVRDLDGGGYGPMHLLLTFTKGNLDRYFAGDMDLPSLTQRVEVLHY